MEITINKNFTLKRLDELKGMTFFVEAYQRGYKWDVQQVLDLLNDIDEFEVIGSRFYCLQPVVVKKIKAEDSRIAEKDIFEKDKVFELIDGQQRLTTVFIILSLLASKDQLPFNLIYKTRSASEQFLTDIAKIPSLSFTLKPDNIVDASCQLNILWQKYVKNNSKIDNVDNYHFFKACQLIHQWSKAKDNQYFFIEKLLHHVKVIWYNMQKDELFDEAKSVAKNAEKIFINFNQGKIQLEQAELIKALFVIKFKENVNLEIRNIHINQFADEWNKIEYQLQDDRFWYFVSNDTSDKKRYNRIDFFFDTLSKKSDKTENPLFSYYHYLKLNSTIDQTVDNWKQLKDLFELLKEWYEDRLMYHLIGIIIYLEIKTIPELIMIYKSKDSVKNKNDFEQQLKSLIAKETSKPAYEIDRLDYKKSPEKTKAILHLFNISTYHIGDFNYRFPFDKLKTQTWSLEHIHAQNAAKFTEKKEFKDWLEDMESLLVDIADEPKLVELKKLLDALTNQELSQIKGQLLRFHDELVATLEMDSIANLCLLDKNTNSSLSNNTFKKKREMVLKVDGTGEIEHDGKKHKVFIPIATKNVFLKYYATEPEKIQFTYWGEQDRNDYIFCIKSLLSKFLSND